jgi:acyl dehydratase
MRFADLHEGLQIYAGCQRVDEAEILEFATKYDPQPFHVDRDAAARTRWGGLIASGWHTCGIAMSLAARNVLAGSASVGSPGIDELRWPVPVRPGNELHLRITVLSRRVSSSGEYGIVRWRWELLNQDETCVLSLVATSLLDVRNASEAAASAP